MEHLIPQEWFIPLSQPVLLLIAAAAIAVLIKGADWLVEGASGLAYRFGLSKVIVGATVVSLGTTSPEAAVSVMAAWSGEPGLALGNAVGSIIADTGLIFGLGCLIARLPADRFVLNRQGWVQFGAASLLAALCYGHWFVQGGDAALGRWVGILFLALLVAYMVASVRWSRHHPHGEPFQTPDELNGKLPVAPHAPEEAERRPLPLIIVAIVVGLALVLVASRLLIGTMTVLAERWAIPDVVIAATLVALGTSLPELVVGLTSVAKGHGELLVGNVIGADILNVLFVIGASATAAHLPIIEHGTKIPEIFLYLHLPSMLLILGLFRIFIRSASSRGSFRRWYGAPLLVIYVVYAALPFLVARG
jgi:cation:H+ antiporter